MRQNNNYYLDIETNGLDPKKNKIITIQYQQLDRNTAKPISKLKILKEWESSEKDILEEFVNSTNILNDYEFSFIPMGYCLNFEHNFLKEKSLAYGLPEIDILSKAFIDLKAFGVIMNRGEFKNSGLDKITGKPQSGRDIPIWHEKKEYDKITEYIEREAEEFVKLCSWLYREMPYALARFKKENRIEK